MNDSMICPDYVLSMFVVSSWRGWISTILWLLDGGCSVFVAVLGLFANLSSVAMVRHFQIRRSVVVFLATLALADSGVCCCSLALYSVAETLKPFLGETMFGQYITVIFYPLSNISMTIAVWTLTAITIEKYRATAKPLQHLSRDTAERAKTICMAVLGAAVVYNGSLFWELTIKSCTHNVTEETVQFVWPTDMRQNRIYLLIYSIICNSIFITIGPFLLITVLSMRIISLVRIARKQRISRLRCNSKQQAGGYDSTTIMLMAVVVKFLLSNVLQIVLNAWETLQPNTITSLLFIIAADVSNFLVVLNSATNFFVYYRWRNALSAKTKSQAPSNLGRRRGRRASSI